MSLIYDLNKNVIFLFLIFRTKLTLAKYYIMYLRQEDNCINNDLFIKIARQRASCDCSHIARGQVMPEGKKFALTFFLFHVLVATDCIRKSFKDGRFISATEFQRRFNCF